MKSSDVKIGGVYQATVTNKRVEVRIEQEKESGGWTATNLATGKKINIKSGRRLTVISKPKPTKGKPAETPKSEARVLKRKPKETNANEAVPDKGLSCIAAALKVLKESSEPMNTKQMIEAMETKGYWASPGGKTPHATLYSAILRDLAKGEDSRFIKVDKGHFVARS